MSKKKKVVYIALAVVFMSFFYNSCYGKYKINEQDKVEIKVKDHFGKAATLEDTELAKELIKEYKSSKRLNDPGKCPYDNELVIYKNHKQILKAKIAGDS